MTTKLVIVSRVIPFLCIFGCSTQNYVYNGVGSITDDGNVSYNYAYMVKSGDDKSSFIQELGAGTSDLVGSEVLFTFPGKALDIEPSSINKDKMTLLADKDNYDIVWIKKTDKADIMSLKSEESGKQSKKVWDVAYDKLINEYNSEKLLLSNRQLIAVEPDYSFYDQKYLDKVEKTELEGAENVTDAQKGTAVVEKEHRIWPGEGIVWHLSNEYSQLAAARDNLLKNVKEPYRVKVAHLDTGYFPNDTLRPRKLLEGESEDFVGKEMKKGEQDGVKKASHGSRTLSSLAGGTANIIDKNGEQKFKGDIGAYPEMSVAEYRINKKSPVHLFPTRMTAAITAAVKNGFDVVSISAGGFPSMTQRDAINYAYENGTAIFAATGDFFILPVFGYSTPKTIAFPARYNRVMGVAGVTASGESYGKAPCYLCLYKVWEWPSWMLRGSYGPASEMKNHTIAAYTPNITHSVGSEPNPDAIDLTGAGTSHATPQVAAAAAIWLEYNRDELNSYWRSWEKTEAVYQALTKSADRCSPYYSIETMGEGTLKADKALKTKIDIAGLKKRKESTVGLSWVKDVVITTDLLNSYQEELALFLKEMLFTEVQQVIHRSDEVRNVMEKLSLIKKRENCESTYDFVLDNKYISEFIEILLKQDISDRLRSLLTMKLKAIAS